MAVFTFTGDPRAPGTDPAVLVMFGMAFPFDKPVTVDDEIVAARLRRHNHFTETGGAGNLGDFDGNGKPGGSIAAVSGIKAVHRGRGKWAVVDGAKTLAEGLTKAEAAAKAAELGA